MITVSESAAKKLNSLIEESGFETPFVRVSVKGGGCSGLSYDLSFDTEQQSNDTLAEIRE
jgi:iron-sulfur cluster assembly protein